MKRNIKLLLKNVLKIFWLLPINSKKVFLIAFDGKKIAFDQRRMIDYINDNNLNYKMIWGIGKRQYKKNLKYKNLIFIKIKSIVGIIHLMTSKIVFYNIDAPIFIPFRKKQILINSWHGLPFKSVGRDVEEVNCSDFNRTTIFLSDSKFYSNTVLRDTFDYSGKILEYGIPRNDIFYDKSEIEKVVKNIKNRYNIHDKKILLYAPTFRNNNEFLDVPLNFIKVLDHLKKKTGDDWIVLIRLHPMIGQIYKNENGIIDVTNYDDTQELLCAADALLSDYSSVLFDFLITHKPMFIYAPDLEKYKQGRGLYDYYYKLPTNINTTQEMLLDDIDSFDIDKYKKNVELLLKKIEFTGKPYSMNKIFKYVVEMEK